MKIEYKLYKGAAINEDGNALETYGIEIWNGERIEKSIIDISPYCDRVSLLINLCNELDLDPIHIYDVIEDYFF